MKNLCLLLLCFICLKTSAQVLSTRKDNAGTITKYARVQFGPDTIQMGVPFHPEEKPGMMISISTSNDENYFTLDLRSGDPVLTKDSIDMHNTSLIFMMNNKDTVDVIPLTKSHFDSMSQRFKRSVRLFMHSYLTDKQLTILKKHKVIGISFYINKQNFAVLSITSKEADQFKTAMRYLTNSKT